jgi:hypothetical protein
MVLGHMVVSWLAHDIIPGQRRAMLNTQVDDLFLGTGGFCKRLCHAPSSLHIGPASYPLDSGTA